MHIRHLAPLALCMAGFLAGCSDKPGIVHMEVSPVAETLSTGETVRLTVSLTSDEMVCLARHYDVAVVLKRIGVDEDSIRPYGRLARCGNAALMLLPVLPVILTARVIDVADVGGRFVLLMPGETLTNNLEVGGGNSVTDWFDQRPPDLQRPRPEYAWWSPGDYRVTVELQNRGNTWPAPLFWSPYSHPVKAETIVHIVGTSTQPAVIESPVQAGEGN